MSEPCTCREEYDPITGRLREVHYCAQHQPISRPRSLQDWLATEHAKDDLAWALRTYVETVIAAGKKVP